MPARQVVDLRLSLGIWPLGERTHFRAALGAGDVALLYVGGQHDDRLSIVGYVELIGPAKPLAPHEQNALLSPCDQAAGFRHGVGTSEGLFFDEPVRIKELAGRITILPPRLTPKWGNYVKAGVKRMTSNDLKVILSATGAPVRSADY